MKLILLISAIGTAIAFVLGIPRRVWRMAVSASNTITEINRLVPALVALCRDFSPNGGSSMRDQLAKAVKRIPEYDKVLADQNIVLAELQAGQKGMRADVDTVLNVQANVVAKLGDIESHGKEVKDALDKRQAGEDSAPRVQT